MTDLSMFEVEATAHLDHVLLEVSTGFAAGFAHVAVEFSDDRTTWYPVPDTTTTILPPGATGLWFDFTHEPGVDPKRWYRARVGAQCTTPVAAR